MDPVFLSVNEVLHLHDRSIREHGGDPSIREPGLVESAVASAMNVWLYGQGTVFDIAAAYAFHIAEAQAFVDGNKRTGAAACLTFLRVNGYSLAGRGDELFNAMIEIAEKRLSKTGLSARLRELAHNIK